ncbi:MAG: LCP family protein [Eubacteriales bacterium]|nr:LCP family protein [Eubacteriales bacterium]
MKTQRDRNDKKSGKKKGLLLAGILLFALSVPLVLLLLLFGRISRPAAAALPQVAATPSSTPMPAATPTPQGDRTSAPTPAPTPTPTPMPLSEVYAQTPLTDAQYAAMDADNSDTANYHNVLLLGIDRRGSTGNSSADTMMIATIDKAHGRLKLTSLLRDTLLEIPDQPDYNKLNAAMAYGGTQLLMQTINQNYRLALTEYVMVDFNMFIQLIDVMDGVTVNMTAEEISAANDCIAGLNRQWGVEYLWDGFIFAEPGNVKCTGKQALGYARIRHLDSDFKRSDRQYQVLKAAFAKFKSQSATQQYAILYKLLPLVETNMTNEAILDCAVQALGMRTQGILHSRMPADDTYQSGRYDSRSVLLTDITQNAWLMHQFIYDNADDAEEAALLTPGASLPPRTPRPTMAVPDINGNPVYYYADDGTLVPGQTLTNVPLPAETPWQSLGEAPAPDPWQSITDAAPAG